MLLSGVVGYSLPVSAQPWMKSSMVSSQSEPLKPGLRRIQQKFEDYWRGKTPANEEQGNIREGGYQQFRRWEWFMKQRSGPDGNSFDPNALMRESRRVKSSGHSLGRMAGSPAWSYLGPIQQTSPGPGAGRVNVFRFHPVNHDIIYLGAASGGIWKSVDGGVHWSALDDFLPSLSIADIAINPRYPDSVYVATGDGYGYEVGGDFWGGTYSAGILVSPDGGLTWNTTGLQYAQSGNEIIQRLVIHPDSPNVLLAATRDGLIRSSDAGGTWSLVRSSHTYDIEFHTIHTDTVFATTRDELLISTDGGMTWNVQSSVNCNGRVSLALSAAMPDRIYVLCEQGELYRSDNLGQSFQMTLDDPDNYCSFYGYYDAVLAVSQTNADSVLCGGLRMALSADGGDSWNTIGNNVHVDMHALDFLPGSGSVLFSGNDGGFYRSLDGGDTWTNFSADLHIKQYYRIGLSQSNFNLLYAGSQDNGTDRFSNGNWSKVSGGDGMDCMVDYVNSDIAYVSYQYGSMQRTLNGGQSFTNISPSSGDWVTPFAMNPSNPRSIYGGYEEVYKSTDRGDNWNAISNFGGGDLMVALSVAPSDSNIIYAAADGWIKRTMDEGLTWTDVSAGLPFSQENLTAVAVSDSDPMKLWVTFSGYTASAKVFSSVDGGSTWMNLSSGLPNLPVNCIVHQSGTFGSIYVGTDLGVYYRDSAIAMWMAFQNGLPNVIVSDLEIQYGVGKIRAGTYGRGVWESDLSQFTPPALEAGLVQLDINLLNGCSGILESELQIVNLGADTIFSLEIQLVTDGTDTSMHVWTGALLPAQTSAITLPADTLAPGTHQLEAVLLNPNGVVDYNPLNNYQSASVTLLGNTASIPVQEGFENQVFPPALWTVNDASGMFALDASTGGFSLSGVSLFADYFHTLDATSMLISPGLDLSSAVAPVTLTFNLAYAYYSANYHDSLIVSVSDDCGITYQRLYEKGDMMLATAPQTFAVFVPQSVSDWRAEQIDLSAYAGIPGVIVRFEAKSGYGNNLYLDDINITDNSTDVDQPVGSTGIAVYPNPARGELFVTKPGGSDGLYSFTLNDLSGRTVMEQNGIVFSMHQTQRIGLPVLSKGVYLLKLEKEGSVVAAKKVVID